MRIEKIGYRQWPVAFRCIIGTVEIVVVTSIGPRIMSLRFAGDENLLYEDRTDFRVGAWRLYGGHRFAAAPESELSYTPDNEPCEVSIKRDHLFVGETNGSCSELLRSFEIGPTPQDSGFEIRHRLQNRSRQAWCGAAWSITCVNPGQVVIPLLAGSERFWSQAGQDYAGASSTQWRRAKDHFLVHPAGEKGKVGLRSQRGWLALLRPEVTFVIQGPELRSDATYPDDGCNVEVYTCAEYLELETLGPLSTLEPGQELYHSEQWHVLPQTFKASDWPLIDRSAGADSNSRR